MEDAAVGTPRPNTLALLGQSLALHRAKPLLLVPVVANALILFVLAQTLGSRKSSAGELASFFAPPPFDVYSMLRVNEGGALRLLVIPGLALNLAAMVALFAVAFRPAQRDQVVRMGAIYVAALASLALPFALSVVYLAARARAAEIVGGVGILAILVLHPFLHLVLGVMFATSLANAFFSGSFRPVLRDGRIWLIGAASTWLWMSVTRRIDALAADLGGSVPYAVALVVLGLQSVLMVAIALAVRATDREEAVVPESLPIEVAKMGQM